MFSEIFSLVLVELFLVCVATFCLSLKIAAFFGYSGIRWQLACGAHNANTKLQ